MSKGGLTILSTKCQYNVFTMCTSPSLHIVHIHIHCILTKIITFHWSLKEVGTLVKTLLTFTKFIIISYSLLATNRFILQTTVMPLDISN